MKLNKNIGAILFESLLIIISVTVSFYIDDWRKERDDKKNASEYLQRIVGNLKEDSIRLDHLGKRIQTIIRRTSYLFLSYEKWTGGAPPINNDSIALTLNTLCFSPFPFEPVDAAYSALKSSGNFNLVSNAELGEELMRYYEINRLGQYMRDYDQLVKSEVWHYVGNNVDVSDFEKVLERKFGQTKSNYKKIYSENLIKATSGYLVGRAGLILPLIQEKQKSNYKIDSLIKKQLNH